MKTQHQLLEECPSLQATVLQRWIDADLVKPHRDASGFLFDDIDEARLSMLCDFHYGMGIDHESLPVILSLVDQLHRTRHYLRAISAAVSEQTEEVRVQIISRAGVVLDRKPGPGK